MTDDGRGLAPDALQDRRGHLGLPAMRDRATIAGGSLTLEPGPRRRHPAAAPPAGPPGRPEAHDDLTPPGKCAAGTGPHQYGPRMDDSTWRDAAWLAGVHAWIDGALTQAGLSRTGEAEQVHVVPWSTVIKVPTSEGPVWFKANAETLRHEAALVERIAARRPDAVPPLLAVGPATRLDADGRRGGDPAGGRTSRAEPRPLARCPAVVRRRPARPHRGRRGPARARRPGHAARRRSRRSTTG